MRIVTYKRIKEFTQSYPAGGVALNEWYHKTKNSNWDNINDVRNTFRSVDYVGNNRYVFNIKGNHYRLVAIVIFLSQKVYIRFIGSHDAYLRIDAKNI